MSPEEIQQLATDLSRSVAEVKSELAKLEEFAKQHGVEFDFGAAHAAVTGMESQVQQIGTLAQPEPATESGGESTEAEHPEQVDPPQADEDGPEAPAAA